jgi:hypothetical protein
MRFATIALLVAVAGCTSGPPPPETRPQVDPVLAWRQAKDLMFRSSGESPLVPAERATFTGLPYFDVDPAFRVPARLIVETSRTPVIIELENSKRQREPLRRVGHLSFTLAGAERTLTAFAPADARTRRSVPSTRSSPRSRAASCSPSGYGCRGSASWAVRRIGCWRGAAWTFPSGSGSALAA